MLAIAALSALSGCGSSSKKTEVPAVTTSSSTQIGQTTPTSVVAGGKDAASTTTAGPQNATLCTAKALYEASDVVELSDAKFFVEKLACVDNLAIAVVSYRVNNPNGHVSEALFRSSGGRWTQLIRSGPQLTQEDLDGTNVSLSTLQELRKRLREVTPYPTE